VQVSKLAITHCQAYTTLGADMSIADWAPIGVCGDGLAASRQDAIEKKLAHHTFSAG
jgi:hypothetical protein